MHFRELFRYKILFGNWSCFIERVFYGGNSMRELEDFTLKQVTDYLIDNIAKERNISKALARKLFINAITYNVVVEDINLQIDFLMEEE